MILKLYFGLNVQPIKVEWFKDVLDFPKVVNYNLRNWEWAFYNGKGVPPNMEYDLNFSELKVYDPRAMDVHPTLAEVIADAIYDDDDCDCGASKHPGTGGHWQFCKLYGK